MNVFKYVLAVMPITTFSPILFAEDSFSEESILTRSDLTGDWKGLRPELIERGIAIDLEYTSTYQGLQSGTGRNNYEYGGKFDAFIKLDSTRLGLWNGGGFHAHLEYRHGEPIAYPGGTLLPVNTALLLPIGSNEKIEATSLYFTQQIGEQASVLFGKINVLDLLVGDSFFGGWGNRRFMHVAFVAPPSGVLPPTIFGAIASLKTDSVNWGFMVYDPNDRTTEYFPDDLFSDGVNVSLSGASSGTLLGRKTTVTIGGTYSTKEGADLSDSLLPPGFEAGTKDGAYSLSFQFSHNLFESSDSPGNGWGLYLKASVADGNPNPIDASVIGGIGGKASFLGRLQDSFGLGYFYYAISNELRNSLEPAFNLDDEQGLEAFYSYAATPWFHITGDIQYIEPASGDRDNTLIIGLRTNIRF